MSKSTGFRILYMEDDPGLSRLLQKSLERQGYTVDLASNGEEGLARVGSTAYDLLLVDYYMPVLGGIDVIRALASTGDFPPVIMVTGEGNEEVAVEALKLGAADYIVKDTEMKYLELLPVVIEQLLFKQQLINERQQMQETARESEERYRRLVELSPDGIAIHVDGVFVFVNPAGARILGAASVDEIVGKPVFDFVHPDFKEKVGERLRQLNSGAENVPWLEERLVRLDGGEVVVETTGTPFPYQGKPGVQVIFRDITGRKQAEEQIMYLAYYDSLTGLPNRTLFKDRLSQVIAAAKRYKKSAALLLCDLDNFKRINDTLGHRLGDVLLKDFAERMSGLVRKSDCVGRNTADELNATMARVGGDEFTMLLTDIQHAEDAAKVATRILKMLSQPFTVDGQEVFISVSIGIAICPADGEDMDTLLKNADSALNHAKNQGRNNFQFYEQSMNTVALKKLTLEGSLRRALERKEFSLFYQPQLDCRTGTMVGMEALIRWKHPEMGMVSPGEFIPLAEETGLIVPIGEWVLSTACAQINAWRQQGLPTVRMSVNLSGKQFEHPDLAPVIARILDEFGVGPNDIVPEITESIIMKNTAKSIATMDELHARGLRFMIDDFGTGYSSLSYLKRFPLYAVKIDGSFVRDITTNSDDAAIANAIIGLAHNLKLRVIAECVETREQLAFLVEHDCDEVQGYLFSPPRPPDEVGDMLIRERDGKGIGLPFRTSIPEKREEKGDG